MTAPMSGYWGIDPAGKTVSLKRLDNNTWAAEPEKAPHEFEGMLSDFSFCWKCWGPESSLIHEVHQEVTV